MVGVIMLDTRFPRIPGDIGNPETFDFPVRFQRVSGASPDAVVRQGAAGLLEPFLDAARALVAEGCDGITTSCGFLSLFQHELAEAAGVPVAASSLMQVPLVNAMLPAGKCAGVLTISGSSLTPRHLIAAGAPEDTPIGTTEGGTEFTRAILNDAETLDIEAARRDNVEAAKALCRAHPEIGALVLECTNMPPYAMDIARETGVPVYSIVSFVEWFQAGLTQRQR